MPVSKAPRKPPSGNNKFLLVTREAKELRAAIGIVVYQNQQLTGWLAQLQARVEKLEDPTRIQIAAPGDVQKEVQAQ